MPKIINASTPPEDRRFYDIGTVYDKTRSFAAKPNTGSVNLKTSFDGGTTYDTIYTFTEENVAGTISTYDMYVEVECTGNAVAVVSNR
jgi:hypothetical protein